MICRRTLNSSPWCLSIYFLLRKLMLLFWRLASVANTTVQTLFGKYYFIFCHFISNKSGGCFRNTKTVGITSLGLEHTAILGDTLTEIAWQKSGIIKENSDVFSVAQPNECMASIRKRCAERNVRNNINNDEFKKKNWYLHVGTREPTFSVSRPPWIEMHIWWTKNGLVNLIVSVFCRFARLRYNGMFCNFSRLFAPK